jgi:hypothetical protein
MSNLDRCGPDGTCNCDMSSLFFFRYFFFLSLPLLPRMSKYECDRKNSEERERMAGCFVKRVKTTPDYF